MANDLVRLRRPVKRPTARKIEHIVLVQPNLRWVDWNFKTLWEIHPIGLLLVAATIEHDYKVTVVDANLDDLSEVDFQARIAELNPDLVGITLLTMEYGPTAHIASRLVKAANPEIVTVLGGIYVTQASELAGVDENLDYLVRGEGELTFKALLQYIEGTGPMPEMGIGYWDESGARVVQERPPFITDLDALELPAFHLVDYQRYTNKLQRISVDSPRALPYGRVISSRGCPVGCTFCEVESISGAPFRTRSVENVLKELTLLKENYGIKAVVWDDDNLYINKKRTRELFRAMTAAKLDLKWNGLAVPVFSVTEELLEIMKESGCEYLDFAIESGVPRVLKEIVHKPVNLDTARKLVTKARSLDIDVVAHFIIGFPGETWAEIRETIRYAESLDADYVKFFIYQPLPHTPLGEKALKEGKIRTGVNLQSDLNWSESSVISDEWTAQDVRFLRAYEWDRINFSNDERRKKIARMMQISDEALAKLRRDTLASAVPVTYPAQNEATEASMANITFG